MRISLPTVAARLGSHAAALAVYFAVFLVIPMAVIAIGIFILVLAALIFNDPGGPLFFPMVAILCLALVASVVVYGCLLFAITLGLHAVRVRWRYPWLLPVLLVPALLLSCLSYLGTPNPAGWTLIFFCPFLVYWGTYACSDRLIAYLASKWAAGSKRCPTSEMHQ